VIFPIDNPGPGFYSHIFVFPKKQKGSWKLIIDLPHFKMETTRSVAAAILPGDWTVSLDLQDAYLYIPVHPDYQHYLGFYFECRLYQFNAMPFRLASAPLIFQSIVKAFVAPLLTLGLKLHFCLDDWLLCNASKDILKTQDHQDIFQNPTAVRSKVLSGKGILMSRRPAELSGRSNPTRQVAPPTSSTSPTLQVETTSGSPGSGNSPSRILTTRSLEIL
jgi:hypothetical protein